MSKTVKVRIPVAVFPKGEWFSEVAASHVDEDSLLEWLKDGIYRNEEKYTVHWIEAEVPIPEPVEVEGRVSE